MLKYLILLGDMMGNSLLSVDWDYFISTENQNVVSFTESKKTIIDLWYKRYIESKMRGKNIQKAFQLTPQADLFWKKVKDYFQFDENVKVYVSDSHSLSYDIAKKFKVDEVYLFDAHSDLGYGGLSSLQFEVNCANWLGKLLHNKLINKAHIIYSPYTKEKPEYFHQINKRFNVNYPKWNDLKTGIQTSVIHICRSGAWSPPWFDKHFVTFVKSLKKPYTVLNYQQRKWDTKNLTLADELEYLSV